MVTFIVLILFSSTIAYDCLTLLKKTSKRGKIIYFALMMISFGILIPYSLDIPMPALSDGIVNVLDALLSIKS
ncbi:MAG: hypothetical protein ACOYI4_05050 [Christensenellales bacterium]|jgi:hypothetical protein